MSQKCHTEELTQFIQSRHGLPVYVAVSASKELSEQMLAQYMTIPEGHFAPDKARNQIAELEGPALRCLACESCHKVGKPAADGSVGPCQKCHSRYGFSPRQARKPETCHNCHVGPDLRDLRLQRLGDRRHDSRCRRTPELGPAFIDQRASAGPGRQQGVHAEHLQCLP